LEVFTLADMYDVDGLVTLATVAVENELSVDNVAEAIRALSLRRASKAVASSYRRICQRARDDEVLNERVINSEDAASLCALELRDVAMQDKIDEIAKLDNLLRCLKEVYEDNNPFVDDAARRRETIASELESLSQKQLLLFVHRREQEEVEPSAEAGEQLTATKISERLSVLGSIIEKYSPQMAGVLRVWKKDIVAHMLGGSIPFGRSLFEASLEAVEKSLRDQGVVAEVLASLQELRNEAMQCEILQQE